MKKIDPKAEPCGTPPYIFFLIVSKVLFVRKSVVSLNMFFIIKTSLIYAKVVDINRSKRKLLLNYGGVQELHLYLCLSILPYCIVTQLK